MIEEEILKKAIKNEFNYKKTAFDILIKIGGNYGL